MKVSLNCLKRFVDLNNLTPEQIANELTIRSVEVESISYLASGTNLTIGQIITCVPHPDSDHLHVLNVDLGKHGVKQIVCGAPNARVGLKVIVAMEGAMLPEVTIKKGVIRGIESNGMCCSLLELGVDRKYLNDYQLAGIEELPADAPIGEDDVLGYLGLDDVIFDLKVLANRPDLLSVINIAKEIASVFERPLSLDLPSVMGDLKSNFVINSKTTNCTQFSIKEIKDLVNGDSPKWMKSYLMAMGIRSINALVDIGNYVMLITGQPLHMYDLDKLSKAELEVVDNYKGEFIALDERKYDLVPGDIVISCQDEPMCLGGVMGALKCATDSNTKNIVIEAASFNGTSVRHTSQRLGLSSESSTRFIKGTNHHQSEFVLNYAAALIKEICGAKKIYQNVVWQSEVNNDNIIVTSFNKINNRLGTKFDEQLIVHTLERLHFEIKKENDNLIVKTPQHRLDVTCDADLSEEVIRLLGFEYVQSELPSLKQCVGKMSDNLYKDRAIEEFLHNRGLDQCLTYTLVNKKECEEFNYLIKGEPYKIINPLTEDHEYVRLSVLPSLIDSAIYNIKRQNKNTALYEISNISSSEEYATILSVVLSGDTNYQHLLSSKNVDFYSLKGIVEGIFDLLGINPTRYSFEKNNLVKELHPGKSCLIKVGKEVVGFFGSLHPKYADYKDLDKTPLVALELRLDKIYALKSGSVKMVEISKFPSVERDLAFIVDKQIMAKDLIKEAKMAGKGIVNNVDVFDVFTGGSLDENSKSIALKIVYSAKDRTLKDEEVNLAQEKIKETLQKKFKAVLRS